MRPNAERTIEQSDGLQRRPASHQGGEPPMSDVTIRRGLDLPFEGEPEQRIEDARAVSSVAIIGLDYIGLKPTMAVAEGDRVSLGQTLFTDKKYPQVRFVAPGSGTVTAIHRGARRVLQAVEIKLEEDAAENDARGKILAGVGREGLGRLDAPRVREGLLESGLWTALRTRPYSKIPAPDSEPAAIFVTATDSNPLAADPAVIIEAYRADFTAGLAALGALTSGPVHVCHAAGSSAPELPSGTRFKATGFDGPHPAGLPGTHIHFLHPVDGSEVVWHIGYQDVIAIGKLFATGELWVTRVVALGGPVVKQPRLLRTRLGASIEDLVSDELESVECRVVSGSVLSGRRAANWSNYLGRYHTQISVIAEGRERELLGWINPTGKKFSAINLFMSSLDRSRKRFPFTSTTNGSPRAMVPIGNYERVVPLDILPTQLLRSLLVFDTDTAQELGCLELDEEDIALCSFVCSGKHDFGPVLRENLERIEREG